MQRCSSVASLLINYLLGRLLYIEIFSGRQVMNQLGGLTRPANVAKADLLNVDFDNPVILVAQVSPYAKAIVGFVSPVSRPGNIVGCGYGIFPVLVLLQFCRMRHNPNVDIVRAGKT